MKAASSILKRLTALLLTLTMVAGAVPVNGISAEALSLQNRQKLDNGYISVTVSDKNGGFGIRTTEGDKVNKSDNDQYLLFEYDEDNTSFTSFQVTRNGQNKEYTSRRFKSQGFGVVPNETCLLKVRSFLANVPNVIATRSGKQTHSEGQGR